MVDTTNLYLYSIKFIFIIYNGFTSLFRSRFFRYLSSPSEPDCSFPAFAFGFILKNLSFLLVFATIIRCCDVKQSLLIYAKCELFSAMNYSVCPEITMYTIIRIVVKYLPNMTVLNIPFF